MSDLDCTLSALFVHPVKSCAGIALDEALLIETGLDIDRAWMVVDEHRIMTIATLRPDGWPQATTVGYRTAP